MQKNITKAIMNPTRMRIVQYLLLHQTATAKEIGEELSDIPKASLYRHIKTLLDHHLIQVVEETRKRGTVEKTYQIAKESPVGEYSDEKASKLIQSSLFQLMGEFERYFTNKENDPRKDLLSLSTCTLLLSDKEMQEFMMKIGQVYQEVLQNAPNEERKARRITLISSPCENE